MMRDIPEQRGLLSRSKVRGLVFRIPEAEIRAIEAVVRDSVDANGAAAWLDTRWKVVKDLMALGILKPWIAGGRTTKHVFVFRRAEMQEVLDRLSAGFPERSCVGEETTITGGAYAYAVSWRSSSKRRWRAGLGCGAG